MRLLTAFRRLVRRDPSGGLRLSLMVWIGSVAMVFLVATPVGFASSPRVEDSRSDPSLSLTYAKRTLDCRSGRDPVTAHVVLFDSRSYRLTVLDLGADLYGAPLDEVFRGAAVVAGINGGFFHADGQPLGLVIAQGRTINRFESAKLLSGVIYGDDHGIHLVRRSRFQNHPGIDALIQSGPFLVEATRSVRGLSDNDPSRRSFIATDWRGHWALGVTLTRLTLAELADCLSAPTTLAPWRVERALNLDGGSSSGFFFDHGVEQAPVLLQPSKAVRNVLGIRRR